MKNKLAFALTGGVLLLSILACSVSFNGNNGGETVRGSGNVVEEEREVSGLTGVELTLQGTLYVEVGSDEALRIEAEDNLLEYIETDMQAGTLVIETRSGYNLNNKKPIKYYLTVIDLKEVSTSSSGDIVSEDLQSESFSIHVSSSGDVTIASLECTTLDVGISSSGDVKIGAGQVKRQKINGSSSGDYNASELPSQEAQVNLSSSGDANIRVSELLTGNLSSSGDIHYIGNPEVDVSSSSSGRVVKVGD